MKVSRTHLLVATLTATTIGGALLAWRQYAELVELRAGSLNRDERADLQKRLWELEKLNRDLQARLAGARPDDGARGSRTAGAGGTSPAREFEGRGGRGDPRGRGDMGLAQMTAIRETLAKPEVQALMNLQQRAGIESRYASLFRNLNATPEQVAKLTALLAERNTTSMDVFNAAREQGIDPRGNPGAFRQLLADAQNDINTSIKSVIGESGFAQLQNYEQTLPQRSLVNELQQRLSYTNTPLTTTQSEQLIQILAANTPVRPAGTETGAPAGPPPNRGPGFGPPGGGRGPDVGGMVMNMVGGGGPGMIPEIVDSAVRISAAPVTAAALNQAQGVLVPQQFAALQQIQQQQQGQQQLDQVFRQAVMPTPPANASGTSAPASSSSPAQPAQRRPGGR